MCTYITISYYKHLSKFLLFSPILFIRHKNVHVRFHNPRLKVRVMLLIKLTNSERYLNVHSFHNMETKINLV